MKEIKHTLLRWNVSKRILGVTNRMQIITMINDPMWGTYRQFPRAKAVRYNIDWFDNRIAPQWAYHLLFLASTCKCNLIDFQFYVCLLQCNAPTSKDSEVISQNYNEETFNESFKNNLENPTLAFGEFNASPIEQSIKPFFWLSFAIVRVSYCLLYRKSLLVSLTQWLYCVGSNAH